MVQVFGMSQGILPILHLTLQKVSGQAPTYPPYMGILILQIISCSTACHK